MLHKRKAYPLNQSPFFRLRSKKRLAELLRIEVAELRRLAKDADTLYSEFDVAKKSGGTRGVENPHRSLKLVQRTIFQILARIAPPDHLFCPVKGRSYVTNAARHRGQRVIHCLDVRRYFPSTSSKRVFWFFNTVMQCEVDVAAVVTRLACYRGHLPTGSPLSPIMACFAHHDMWEAIAAHCRMHGYNLSVYIDDVTISGSALDPKVIWAIKEAIHRTGLRYHKEKRFVGGVAEVTGVIVRGKRLLAPNRQLKKLTETRVALNKRPEGAVDKVTRQLQDRMLGLSGQLAQIAAV